MNQIFSIKRYGWLLKRQWYENAAIYKWGIVFMVIGIPILFWLFGTWRLADNPRLDQIRVFTILPGIFVFLLGATFFESLNSKHKGMFYFSLPVSTLERIAVAFTYEMILMPVLVLTIFTVFDFVFVQLFNHIHEASEQMFFKTTIPNGSRIVMFVSLLVFLSFTSIFTICSLRYGKKGPMISVIFIVGFMIFFLLYRASVGTLQVGDFFKSNFSILPIPVCWTAMYFVMKRKQV